MGDIVEDLLEMGEIQAKLFDPPILYLEAAEEIQSLRKRLREARDAGLEAAARYHEGAVTRILSNASSYNIHGNMKTDRRKASNVHEYSASAIRSMKGEAK